MRIETQIHLDRFKPRKFQLPLFDAFENKGCKKIVAVWPRRSGKDICAFNLMIRESLKKVGVYYYIFPSYSQARKVIWDSLTNDGKRFLDFIPPELVDRTNSQEMKIYLINGSLIQLIGSDNIDCFDDQTEILSENGWMLFKDLDPHDKVATLKDGALVYDVPTQHVEYDYNGPMYRINSHSLDLLVTPNHRFYVRSSKGFYKFKRIDDPTIRHDSIPSKCDWKGDAPEYFEFPVVDRIAHGCRGVDRRVMKMDDFVALLGIYLAEGSTFRDSKNYRVTISQKKERGKAEIRELLTRCGLVFNEWGTNFVINCRQMYYYFESLGKQHERFIPKDIKNLSKMHLKILFEWMVMGDGYRKGNTTHYYSVSKKLVDDVQEIVIKIGLSANITIKPQKESFIKGRIVSPRRTLYDIRIRISSFKRLQSTKKKYITQTSYAGKVYCVSVPSGVIKVRRNGKECWSGNSVVGSNPRGCVFSEYALQHPRAYQFIRPILAANDGWALFVSTPRGKNPFWELYQIATKSKDWFVTHLTLDDTQHIPMHEIERERAEGLMSEDLIQQEYYTSFTMGVEGAYYAKYIDRCRLDGRVGDVPWEASFAVHTAWDLGVRDATSIIFFQCIGQTVRIIDCYENSKEGLEHYVNVIKSKPYTYGKHIAPHDIQVKEFGTGMTRLEKARNLGIKFTVARNISIVDGIEAVRSCFSKVWIDEKNCSQLIKALENYRQEYDEKKKVYKPAPLHNWASHFCDSMRYLAVSLPRMRDGLSSEDIERNYYEALYGSDQSNLPSIFRDDLPKY